MGSSGIGLVSLQEERTPGVHIHREVGRIQAEGRGLGETHPADTSGKCSCLLSNAFPNDRLT